MFEQCRWINEPAQWRVDNDTLVVTTDANTDFWRKTHGQAGMVQAVLEGANNHASNSIPRARNCRIPLTRCARALSASPARICS